MKQHEREYFISRLRAGVVTLMERGLKLKVYSPTIEEEYEANQVYSDACDAALVDGILGEEEVFEWMKDKGLWNEENENVVKGLEKDMEKLKVEIFNARNREKLREHIRKYIRAGELQLVRELSKKHVHDTNTREGIAAMEKLQWIIKNCTFLDGELYDFDDVMPDTVISSYQASFLSEGQARELARNEPWRSLWTVSDKAGKPLFADSGRILTLDQKNIIIWSTMYDNIQESMDCPNNDVIEDDDMLDGWFIVQRKKREKEKTEQEFENSTTSNKITNADEVFVVADAPADVERVQSMNDLTGRMRIKERAAVINSSESVNQGEFKDEQRKLQRESNRQFKDQFGG